MHDDDLWNVRFAAFGTAFPIFPNDLLPSLDLDNGETLVNNGKMMFDDKSVMNIQGVGTFYGWSAISSYLAVPHPAVSGLLSHLSVKERGFHIVGANTVVGTAVRGEVWNHIPGKYFDVPWRIELRFYPCSTKIASFIVRLPKITTENFVSSSQVPGTIESVCRRIMTHCTGDFQQYDSLDDCMAYMEALPLIDPICREKYGDFAVQGNCFMCKFLHQFMTPFEPHLHCFHAGKGRFDANGKRKCVPTDCYDQATTSPALKPHLLFPPDAVPSETVFEPTTVNHSSNNNGTASAIEFVETLMVPQVERDLTQHAASCADDTADLIAAATVRALPFCMPSLSYGVASANCTQAVSVLLGRFAENGDLCLCQNQVSSRSVMLDYLSIDAQLLLEFAWSKIENINRVPHCLEPRWKLTSCPEVGSYTGKDRCYKWDFAALEQAVYRDWSPEAQFYGRTTKSDAVASSECSVLGNWQRQVKSRDLYDFFFYVPSGGAMFPDADKELRVHPSMETLERRYNRVLKAIQSHQNRTRTYLMSETCYFGTTKAIHSTVLEGAREFVGDDVLTPSVGFATGSELHQRTRDFQSLLMPGLWGTPEEGHGFSNILSRVMQVRNLTEYDIQVLDIRDMYSTILEVFLRGTFEDEILYDGDDFSDKVDKFTGGILRGEWLHNVHGNVWPSTFQTYKYQLERHLKDSGVLPLGKMKSLLEQVGLDTVIKADGMRGAYGWLVTTFASQAAAAAQFCNMILRSRYDECETRHYWKMAGPKNWIMENLRLSTPVGTIAQVQGDQKYRMYEISGAHRDPTVFQDPFKFNPFRKNFHQMMTFNGLESDFDLHSDESGYFDPKAAPSLKRGCMGRSFAMRLFTELAPRFFPPASDDYQCLDERGSRVWHGIRFVSDLITVEDGIQVEVLKADGQDSGENLMILLHGLVDVPVGWSKFIRKMRDRRSRQDIHYWSLVMPGWGGKATPIDQCDWPRLGRYVADVIRHAKKSYKRVFLFGRDDGGLLGYYAAHTAGRKNLHGFITNTMPPAMYALWKMSQPLENFARSFLLDPVSDLYITGSSYPLEDRLKNGTWWNDGWEWEFRSMWKKTGPSQLACQTRSNFNGDTGKLRFHDLDAARELDPNMHMLTISHEFSLSQPELAVRLGLKSTTPRPGIVQIFKQIREKPDMHACFYDDDGAAELAEVVTDFVDQSVAVKYSFWNLLNYPIRFDESSFVRKERWPTIFFFAFILTFIMMLTGFCGELTVGSMLVSHATFGVYVCSQVFAAVLVLASVLSAAPLSMPMYTLGLFKCFYPEITSNILGPFRHPEVYYHRPVVRVFGFLSGVSYIPHHFGATLCYVSVLFLETDIFSIAFVSLAVCFQHLSALIKYTLPGCYVVTIMGLEIWFQLESYYLLTYAVISVRLGVTMVLLSHYVWFLEGCLLFWHEHLFPKDESERMLAIREEAQVAYEPRLKFDRSGKSMRLYKKFADAGGVIPEHSLRKSFGAVGMGDVRSPTRVSFWDSNNPAFLEVQRAARDYVSQGSFHVDNSFHIDSAHSSISPRRQSVGAMKVSMKANTIIEDETENDQDDEQPTRKVKKGAKQVTILEEIDNQDDEQPTLKVKTVAKHVTIPEEVDDQDDEQPTLEVQKVAKHVTILEGEDESEEFSSALFSLPSELSKESL